MKELVVLLFGTLLLAGCAVVTPYGTSLYVPDPEITILPFPYSYPYYPYGYYPYASYPYYSPWYAWWRPGWNSWGFSYYLDGHGGPPRHYGGHGGPPRHHGGYGGHRGPSRH